MEITLKPRITLILEIALPLGFTTVLEIPLPLGFTTVLEIPAEDHEGSGIPQACFVLLSTVSTNILT